MPKNAMRRARLMTALAFCLAAPGAWATGAGPKKPKKPAAPPAKTEGTPTCEQIIKDAGENARNILPCLIAAHPESRKEIAQRLQSFLLTPRLTYRYAPASLTGKARSKTKAAVKTWAEKAAAQALSDLYIVAGWPAGNPPAWVAESPKMKKDWSGWAYQRLKQKLETALIARWSEKVDGPEKASLFLADAAAQAGKVLDGPDGKSLRLKKPVGFGGSAPVDPAAVRAFQAEVADLAGLLRGAHWGHSPQDVQVDGAVYAKVYSPKDKGYRWLALKKGVQNGAFGYFITDVTALLDVDGRPVAHLKEGASKPQFFKSAPGERALNLYPDSAKPIKYKLSFGGDGAVTIWRDGDDVKRAGEGIFRTTTKDADAKWAGYVSSRGFRFLGAQLNFVVYQPDGSALFVPRDKAAAGDPKTDFRIADLAGLDAQGNAALSGGDKGHLFYLHCAGGVCEPMAGKVPSPPKPASEAGHGAGGEGGGPNAGPNGGPTAGPNGGPGGGGPQSDGPEENHAQGLYSGDPVLNHYIQRNLARHQYFPLSDVDSRLSGAFKKLVYVLKGSYDQTLGYEPAYYAFRPRRGEPKAIAFIPNENSRITGFSSRPTGHGDYIELVESGNGQTQATFYSARGFLRHLREEDKNDSATPNVYSIKGDQANQMQLVENVDIALIIMHEYMGFKGDDAAIRRLVKEHAHGKPFKITGTKAAVILGTDGPPYELWPHPGTPKGLPSKVGKNEGRNGHPGQVAAHHGGDDTATEVTKDWVPQGQGDISCRSKKLAAHGKAGVFVCGEDQNRQWWVAFQALDQHGNQVVRYGPFKTYHDWPFKKPKERLHVQGLAHVKVPEDFKVVIITNKNETNGVWCAHRKYDDKVLHRVGHPTSGGGISQGAWNKDTAGWVLSWGLTAEQADTACKTRSIN